MFVRVLTTPTMFYGLLEIKEHNRFKTKKEEFFAFLCIAIFYLLFELCHYIDIEDHPQWK